MIKVGVTAPGIWLKIAKKSSMIPSVTYDEAIDEALCCGWIDGQRRRALDNDNDDARYYFLQRFTPRRRRSTWSQRNVDKVAALAAVAGRMLPAGLAEVDAAKADGRWEKAYAGSATMEVPADFRALLDERPRAAKVFDDEMSKAARYTFLQRLQTVKKEETRTRKMAEFHLIIIGVKVLDKMKDAPTGLAMDFSKFLGSRCNCSYESVLVRRELDLPVMSRWSMGLLPMQHAQHCLAGHPAYAHQLCRLHHGGIHAYAGGRHHRVPTGIVDDELALLKVALKNQIIPSTDRRARIAAVPQLRAERGPKDGDKERRRGAGVDNVLGGRATGVLRHVPVLNAGVLAVASGAVVRVCCNVANGVDVFESLHQKILVRLERAVFLETKDRVVAQVLGGGRDTDAENHEVRLDPGPVLEVDGANVGWVGARGLGLVDASIHMKLDAFAFKRLLDGGANFFAEDAVQGHLFHANYGDGVVLAGGAGHLHADKRGADNDNLFALALPNGRVDLFRIVHAAQRKDVAENFEALQGEQARGAARGEDELGVGVRAAALGADGAGGKVDVVHLAVYPADGTGVEPALAAPGELGGVGDEGLAQLGTVNGQVALVGDDGDRSVEALFAEALDGAHGAGAAADDDDVALVFGRGANVAAEVGSAAGVFDGGFVAGDVDGAVAFGELERGQGVECGGALNIPGPDIEAGCSVSF
ncbi:hypothetical protein CRV24_007220 [Beauveria bassiana]|nr:hypothetical protein CRV24_007220 [Beauveria bassiana]